MATAAYLQKAYLAYFGRPADVTGLAAFANATEAQVQAAFSASAESVALYGTSVTANFINSIYVNVLGRAAEPAGITYWLNQIAIGAVTQAGAAVAILNGAQGTDVTTVNNKIAAATAFTAGLDTNAEVVGYSGTTAAASARTWLATVTSTAATQTSIDAAIVSAVAGGTNTSGETYTLTTAINQFTGGTGNDTFIGDAATASAADQLVGGTGTDTLKLYGNAAKPTFSGIETVYLNGNTAGMDLTVNTDVTALQLDDVATGQDYTIGSAVTTVSVSNMANAEVVDFKGNTVTALTVNLNTNGGQTAATDVELDFNSTAQTAVTLNTTGAKSGIQLVNTGAKIATVTVTGDQTLSIDTALTTITTLNASAATAALTVLGIGASNLTFTGGSGNDKLVFANTLTASDKLDGGAGTDTLTISDADTMDTAAEVANIVNFETFQAAAADGTTYDLSFLNAKNTITGLEINGGATVTVSNINAATTGNIKVLADTTTVLSATDFVSGGTSDTATITLQDLDATGSGIDIANLTFANLDVLNLISTGDSTPTKTIGGAEEQTVKLTCTDLEKIVVSGTEAIVVEAAATTASLTEVDASAMTAAAVSIDTDAAAIASILVKGGAKNDTIDIDNAATLSSTIYTGGGTDTVKLAGGGTAVHTFKFAATDFTGADFKAGGVINIDMDVAAAAGDTVRLDFGTAIEGLLKSAGATMAAATANVAITGTTLSATTNVAASVATAGGADTVTMNFDLNGDGAYVAADDFQITIKATGVAGTDDTLVYNAASDYFVWTVV